MKQCALQSSGIGSKRIVELLQHNMNNAHWPVWLWNELRLLVLNHGIIDALIMLHKPVKITQLRKKDHRLPNKYCFRVDNLMTNKVFSLSIRIIKNGRHY